MTNHNHKRGKGRKLLYGHYLPVLRQLKKTSSNIIISTLLSSLAVSSHKNVITVEVRKSNKANDKELSFK